MFIYVSIHTQQSLCDSTPLKKENDKPTTFGEEKKSDYSASLLK